MTRSRRLGVYSATPNATPRDERRRGVLVDVAVYTLIVAALAALTVWWLGDVMGRALDHALEHRERMVLLEPGCAPPTEHEVLHVVVVKRADRIVPACRYLGPRGAYRRTPQGMPEPRP